MIIKNTSFISSNTYQNVLPKNTTDLLMIFKWGLGPISDISARH